jgi:GrpB-like predicted nucleotidyltransferase (UPF0157 family)/chloramphenicol 3-O-phosphotransferase
LQPPEPVVYVLSGPMAVGKSTVARLLATRFARGVHLEGDVFRRFVVSGRAETTPEESAEASEQLRLRYRLAAQAADTYADAGFTVVLEDVVGPGYLGDLRTSIRHRPCHVVVLMASVEKLTEREHARGGGGYGTWSVGELHRQFAAGPRIGVWLDTSAISPERATESILAATTGSREPIVVTDYDASWPALFEQLARPLRDAVRDVGASVEHVGSTAVPGLAAKPVIDIDVVVRAPGDVAPAVERLCALGYVYQGDKGVAGREAFLWPPGMRQHHVYVVVDGSTPHRNHATFRDYLRAHPAVAAEYAALKRELAARYGRDGIGYTEAKDEFVANALREAL